MMKDLISSSKAEDEVLRLSPSEPVRDAMLELREFMYQNVYRSPRVEQDFEKSKKILSELYAHFLKNESLLHQGLSDLQMGGGNYDGIARERLACDFIASMTDRYAMNLYANLFFPSPFSQKVN
jgi:dGTPase